MQTAVSGRGRGRMVGHPSDEAWYDLRSFVGAAIHVVRVGTKRTQQEVATRMAQFSGRPVQQNYISKIESGEIVPSLERLGMLCGALGTTPDRVIKIAQFMSDNAGQSDEQVLKQIIGR